MKKIKIKYDFILIALTLVYGFHYGIIFSYDIVIPFLNILLNTIAIILLFWSFYIKKNLILEYKVLLTLCFLGSDYLLFIVAAIIIPKMLYRYKNNTKTHKAYIILFIVGCYGILISLFMSFIIDFFILSTVAGIFIFFSPLIFVFYFSRYSYSQAFTRVVFLFFNKIIVFQLVILIFQCILCGSFKPGDWGQGSLGISDKVGVFIVLLLFNKIIPYFLSSKIKFLYFFNPTRFLSCLFLLLVIIYIDMKITFFCMLIALFFLIFLILIQKIKKAVKYISKHKIVSTVFIVVLFIVLLPTIMSKYYAVMFKANSLNYNFQKIVSKYVDPETSQKYILYKRTFLEMNQDHFWTWFFGTGFGKFGSRASNVFAYDVLYKTENNKISSFIPSHSSIWVKKYMSDLYTKNVYEGIQWRSANLSTPFSGMITAKGELGIIGPFVWFFVFFILAIKLIRKSSVFDDQLLKSWSMVIAIYSLSLPFLMVIDNWQEKPQFIFPLFILSCLLIKSKREGLNEKSRELERN